MDVSKIGVRLEGVSDIKFDRFIDHSKEVRPAEQKFYLSDGNALVLPSTNIIEGFLFGQNPAGCAKAFEGKAGKDYIAVGLSHVFVGPNLIPFLDNKKKQIKFTDFNNGRFRVDYTAGRTKMGSLSIKQEAKPRPVMHLPWAVEFDITVLKNTLIDETKLYNWFVRGGMQIAIGTHRPVYGRFVVDKWETK